MYTCVCRFRSAFTSRRDSEANSVRKELPCTCKWPAICAETGPFFLEKSSAKETSGICCGKEKSAGQGACCWLKLREGRDSGVSPSVYLRHVCVRCLGAQDVLKLGLTS